MEQRCTCGALLPPDARFCHKCGQPQYEEDIQRIAAFEAEAAPKPVVSPVAAQLPDSGVGNMMAIGISMAAAALAFVGMFIVGMLIPPLIPVILCAAGFAAARFYGSRRAISAITGALLGSMTGFWLFLVFAFGLGIISFGLTTPAAQQMLKSQPPQMAAVYAAIQDPHQMFMALITLFFALIFSSAFGGLLAVSTRRPNR